MDMMQAESIDTFSKELDAEVAEINGSGIGPSLSLPLGVIVQVLSFLDAESLSQCSQTCLELYEICDLPILWKAVALERYPLASELGDVHMYNGEWKSMLLDRKRRYRSTMFEWDVGNCLKDTRRRYSPTFTLQNFTFQLTMDPNGNPYIPLAKPGVSVYLSCCSTRLVRPPTDVHGKMQVVNDEEEEEEEVASPEGGRTQAWTSEDLNWECCLAFTISVINQTGCKKNLMWTSNLPKDRFNHDCREWGVHRLISLRRLSDLNNGYLGPNDSIKIQCRIRLLYYRVKVFTSTALHKHHSFGIASLSEVSDEIVPTNVNNNISLPPCTPPIARTYEVWQCMRTDHFRAMLARDFGIASPSSIRLWVVTQPWADSVAVPRVLIKADDETFEPMLEEEDLVLSNYLAAHQDGIDTSRIWMEVAGDGGLVLEEEESTGLGMTQEGQNLPHLFLLSDPADPLEVAEAAEVAAVMANIQAANDAIEEDATAAATTTTTTVESPLAGSVMEGEQGVEVEVEEDKCDSNLLFFKYLDNKTDHQVSYLTHFIVPVRTSFNSVLEVVHDLLSAKYPDMYRGEKKEDLRVLVEGLPTNCQPGTGAERLGTQQQQELIQPRCRWLPWQTEERVELQAGATEETSKKRRRMSKVEAKTNFKNLKIENGQILCVVPKGYEHLLEQIYVNLTQNVLEEAAAIYNYTSTRAQVKFDQACPTSLLPHIRPRRSRLSPRLRFDHVVDLFEKMGNQRFRIRNTNIERNHQSARETLRYALVGRHLGFCCDRCGISDFQGPRYKCSICTDYDLCQSCHDLPVEQHRYRFGERKWTKEEFDQHKAEHPMVVIQAIPGRNILAAALPPYPSSS